MQTPIQSTARFTAMPNDETLAATVAALEARGFGTEVVENLDAAREAVLARIPHGSSVATNSSVTLEETGIAAAINDDDGPYDSARKVLTLDRATQMREIKAIMLQPDYALGSVHAVTLDGALVLASALGSQLAAYSWGATNVVLVVGTQKLVPDLATAHNRIRRYCLELENERALAAYGRGSYIGKILEIHHDEPGRTHVVLIRQAVGF